MGGGDEVGDDFIHASAVEFGGAGVVVVEANWGWSHGLPTTFGGRNGAVFVPWNRHRGFASSVGELGAGVGAVLVEKGGDALEFGDMLVFPDAEVGWGDAAFRADGDGFGDDQRGPADGTAAQVDEVPVIGEAVDAGVFAHGRDGDTVWESEAAELKRGEEMIYRLGHGDWMLSIRFPLGI